MTILLLAWALAILGTLSGQWDGCLIALFIAFLFLRMIACFIEEGNIV